MKVFLFLLLVGLAVAVEIISKDGSVNHRVHGGHHAVLKQFPWNAAVENSKGFLCSAAMVTQSSLLTSAECVKDYPAIGFIDVYVRLGELQHNLGTPYILQEIKIHPDYKTQTNYDITEIYHPFNIAILKTAIEIEFSNFVAPISLPKTDTPLADGTYVQLCGWGGQKDTVQLDLQFVYMSTKSVYSCIQEIGGNPSIEYFYNLCTPGFQPESGAYSGACHYDHGAGLIIDYNTSPILVGLVSYANCDNALFRPTIYTSIIAHREWLSKNIV